MASVSTYLNFARDGEAALGVRKDMAPLPQAPRVGPHLKLSNTTIEVHRVPAD
jgi:hypothetical protein